MSIAKVSNNKDYRIVFQPLVYRIQLSFVTSSVESVAIIMLMVFEYQLFKWYQTYLIHSFSNHFPYKLKQLEMILINTT